MAKKRDIVIAVLIISAAMFSFIIFGLMFVGIFSAGDGMDITGFGGGGVGVIELYGGIYEANGREVIEDIDRWTDNNSIKAVVIHINSPGGGVAISQEIYDAVLRLREEKPVVAAMAGVAASGGYLVACAADRIIANPGTITGSIGVIFQFHTYTELMDKVGVGTETIKSGELKDVGSYSREMTKKEELMLRSVVMDTYEQFIEVVAEGRSKEIDDIRPLADGSIYTGEQAYNLGLVDTLGSLHDAILLAANLADMDGTPNVVRPYKRDKVSVFDLMSGLLGDIRGKIGVRSESPMLLYQYQ